MPPAVLVAVAAVWLGCAATLVIVSGWAGLGLFLAASAIGCCGYYAAGWPGVAVATAAVLVMGLMA